MLKGRDRVYKIISLISKGGFSRIYLLKDFLSNFYIAKEFVFNKYDENSQILLNYFKREAEFLENNKKSDYIPLFIEFLQMENKFYIIEEYIKGFSLADYINFLYINNLKISNTKIGCIIKFIVDFFIWFYSLDEKFIYRDLKPENILWSIKDAKLKIIDFGSLTPLGDKKEVTLPLATYGYAAPEVFKTNYIDISVDLYSIAALLYFLLTGNIYKRENTTKLDISNDFKIILKRNLSENKEDRLDLFALKDLLKYDCKKFSLNMPIENNLVRASFCNNCLKEIKDDKALFCLDCGMPLYFAHLHFLKDNFDFISYPLKLKNERGKFIFYNNLILQDFPIFKNIEILNNKGTFYLKLLDNKFEVFVNKVKVNNIHPLFNLDIITINNLTFIFVLKNINF